jgi:hypothetical protein
MTSVFASYTDKAWPHRFHGAIRVHNLAGGVPTDPNVAEGWLKTKLAAKDDLIREAVAQTMVDRGVTADEAAKLVDTNKHLNGFKRDDQGLYIEGRQLKAAIKEAAGVARATDKLKPKWGTTNKGVLGFVAEHIMVIEDRLHLGVDEPTGVLQSFPKNPRTGQTGIQYTEYIETAEFSFTVISDYDFTDHEWAMLWLTGEQQGVGASRSQGFGRYEVIKWEATR